MIDQALQKLIDMVSSLAPHLWEIAMRQVYVLAFQNATILILGFVFLFLGAPLRKKGQEMRAESESTFWEIPTILGYVIPVLGGIMMFGSIYSIGGYLINPQFYAIKLLLEAAAGK